MHKMSAIRSQGGRYLHRGFSTTPRIYESSTTSTIESTQSSSSPDLAQQLASNDPTAINEYLKLEHDGHAIKTSQSLARLSKNLTKLHFELNALSDSLSTVNPPRSYQRSTCRRSDTIAPYVVQAWKKKDLRVEERAARYGEHAERLRLHLQDLVGEPFPADEEARPAEVVRTTFTEAGMKEQRLREVNLRLDGDRNRAKQRMDMLVDSVKAMKQREETKKELTAQAEAERIRLQEVERVQLPHGVGVGKEEQAAAEGQAGQEGVLQGPKRPSARALKRQRAIQRVKTRRRASMHGIGRVNEDGTMSFSPLVGDNAAEEKDAKLAKRWFSGSGKKSEEKTKQEAAPEPMKDKASEKMDSKAMLLASQARLDKVMGSK